MTFEEMLAAAKEMAEGDGEDADKAKKMVAALESEEEGAKAEGEEEEEPKSKKEPVAEESEEEEPKSKKAAAAAALTPIGELAAQVQHLSGKVKSLEGTKAETDRKEILAKRPDLAKELVAIALKKNKAGAYVTPLSVVRDICKVPGSPKAKLSAEASVKPTPAAGQGGNVLGGVTRASAQADALDAAFGLKPEKGTIRREGGVVTFGVMTPDEARAHAAKMQSSAAAKEGGR